MKIDDFLNGAMGEDEAVPEKEEVSSIESDVPVPEPSSAGDMPEVPDVSTDVTKKDDKKKDAIDRNAPLEKQVHQVLDEFEKFVKSKDLREVARVYADLQDISHRLSREQVSIQKDVIVKLNKTNEILIEELRKLSATTDSRIMEIRTLINRGNALVEKNSLDMATEVYKDVKKLYDDLPDQLDERKVATQQAVLRFFLFLKNKMNAQSLMAFKKISYQIKTLVNNGKIALRNRNIKQAKVNYDNASLLYKKLPDGFLQQKAILYKGILKVYNEISLSAEISYLQRELMGLQKSDPVHRKPVAPKVPVRRVKSVQVKPLPKALNVAKPSVVPVRPHVAPSAIPARPVNVVQKVVAPMPQAPKNKFEVPSISDLSKPPETPIPNKAIPQPKQRVQRFPKRVSHDLDTVKSSLAQAKVLRAQYEISDSQLDSARQDVENALQLDPGNKKARDLLTKLDSQHNHTT